MHPSKEIFIRKTTIDIKFIFVILFICSVFLISNDDTLKIASMNASSLVSILMVSIYTIDSFVRGKFVLQKHPIQNPLFLLFIWAVISFLISKIDPSKAIPDEAYFYSWASGLNSPSWRGISFLLRLFLSIFAIEFIISNVNSKIKYYYVVNVTLLLYFAICLFGLLQIVLFWLGDIEIGKITIVPGIENFFRIGGYVGEPQTFGILLVCGYFIVIASLQYPHREIWLNKRFLIFILVVATIDLIFTFSVSMILGILVALLFMLRKSIIKHKFITVIILITAVFTISGGVFYDVVIAKLLTQPFAINSRTLTWILGMSIFIKNPLSGIGIGQSPLVSALYIPPSMIDSVARYLSIEDVRTQPMNTYVEWLSETGIIGMLILIYLIYSLYKLGRNSFISVEQKYVCLTSGGALLAMAVAANSGGGIFYIGFINLQFAMFISGMVLFKNNDKPEHRPRLRHE